ncbi:MAG: PSD1 and planctomycete cytochrome C domain-containing protein [Pirellulales bacterium]
MIDHRDHHAGRLLQAIQSLLLVLLCPVAAAAAAPAASGSPTAAHLAVYSEKLRPLLAERCFSCHGGLKQEAGLRLDTVALMIEGGESGGIVTKGDPDASLILDRVSDTDPITRMPPEGEGEPLSAEQVAMLSDWIKAGCPAPADEKPEADPRDHWAFQPRVRPEVPTVKNTGWVNNSIDAFLAIRHEEAGIAPQPEAPRYALVRRLYLDLIGLPPQAEELAAIEADASADWYEKLVEKLLVDPRHGERWGRHWMDVWRYADWWGLGNEHRYSQKHMWHFRDWIVESLNADTPYDEMVRLMLAADELHPDDPAKLRATGFLARNWFLFNRTPWLDETVEHVGKGLLGITMNCSKCHAHKYDPIQQEDYYKFRAFFAPIQTRLDVVAGESNLEKNGIPRVFDGGLDEPTYLFVRGEDTKPDTSKKIEPGVPEVFSFRKIEIKPVALPKAAFEPERRPWVLDAYLATARQGVADAEAKQAKEPSAANEQAVADAKAELVAVEKRAAATRAAWAADDSPSQAADDPLKEKAADAAKTAAKAEKDAVVVKAWGSVAVVSAKLTKAATEKKDAAALAAIEKELGTAREAVDKAVKAAAEPGETFTPLVGAKWTPTRFKNSGADDPAVAFSATSTGRRTALAHWITDPRNPLTARVAANHIWMRHMGTPLVTTVFEFGRKGNAPTHPELLDWLASELVDGPPQAEGKAGPGWSMKHLHRLICTSAAYRMGSSTKEALAALAADPDNTLLWRREPVRLESQVVRDAVLALAGTLDPTMGGPSVPEGQQASSRRRSLYLWHSDISRDLFLTMFDDASVTECYRRDQSIVPQQALALSNAALVHDSAAKIVERIAAAGVPAGDDSAFLDRAFGLVLHRPPTAEEKAAFAGALAKWRAIEKPAGNADPARVYAVWTLFNHNDFVTLR